MATSAIDIINLALIELGETPITSLSDNVKSARIMNALYEHTRDHLLSLNFWSFAIKRAELAALTTEPEFDFGYEYELPSDFIRLYETAETRDYAKEGTKILANTSGPLRIIYVSRVTDPNTFGAAFIDAFIALLAANACEAIKQSSSDKERLLAKFERSLARAARIDSQQKPPSEPDMVDWLSTRY